MYPVAVAINPSNASDLWMFYVPPSIDDEGQLVEGGEQIAAGLPRRAGGDFTPLVHTILFDPLTGRVYVDAAERIYAFDSLRRRFVPLRITARIDHIAAIT